MAHEGVAAVGGEREALGVAADLDVLGTEEGVGGVACARSALAVLAMTPRHAHRRALDGDADGAAQALT